MKVFNLSGDELDEARDREGWRIRETFVGTSRTRSGCWSSPASRRCERPMLSSRIQPDVIHYPDTGKMLATDAAGDGIMLASRGPTLEYWEGED